MDLPDCPPGAEGYEDTVTEVAKKIDVTELTSTCTKAEQEFQQHLNSLKIKTEDGQFRCMVERRGRDISGKWIYLCYPCAAMCSGEGVLQTHISGKKHKNKLAIRNVWPTSIFEEHPYILNEKGTTKSTPSEKVLQKMAEEVEMYKKPASELDLKYDKYRDVRCHIQDTLDAVRAPLLGIEYLIEHPPEQPHYEPSYICVLCIKQGHPRTIVNHLTCFWHRHNYLLRHFNKAAALMAPYRSQTKYREGVTVILNRLAQRIQDKYGRLRPVNIDKEEYEKDRDQIHQWLFKGQHFVETEKCTFEEVVDPDLITSLDSTKIGISRKKRDPSPPIVAAPTKPAGSYNSSKRGKAADALEALSDVSDEPEFRTTRDDRVHRGRLETKRFEPYPENRRVSPFRSRYAIRNTPNKTEEKPTRPPNYEYKLKLAADQRNSAEELGRKALAYHEKNPEKHPLYPEEWKKFWNRRYKEIQAGGSDPSKHDFKPEWIVFWTSRMKELHEEEMRSTVAEIYRRLRVTPPDMSQRVESDRSEIKRRSPERRRSPEHRRTPERRRSPERRKSPDPRRPPRPSRSSPPRRRSPESRKAPPRRPSPVTRRRSPDIRDRRSPERRSTQPQPQRRGSPLRMLRTRSRSPMPRSLNPSPPHRRPARSPLSRRESAPRNHSPRKTAPSLDTVLVSDEEFRPDDGLSPWNSDDSLGSVLEGRSPVARRSRTGSVASRNSRRPDMYKKSKPQAPQDFGAAENVVATLRLLVALEDYLGSLGPKIVDLLAEALKMEKDKANSSEELLEDETAVVMIETAKEKLKGAVQAGLVSGGAAAAVRAAVVRTAATLHEADKRIKKKKQEKASISASSATAAVPVAGVGEVDREQIAQQMAAALIAQGKTDVSSDELAQLVDAVVGMAEAKKRETVSKQKVEDRAANDKSTRPAVVVSGKASALQMLQSAYDDKKIEDAPDAMDGLSDSDLETLLKNFNELSAEEQHSLIAYLKKLEAREPQRVEKLRQYVSAAATNAPIEEVAKQTVEPVTIESDDDDYTVEDIFKSATAKVKEDRIRQEMEIVKKSLEETKSTPEISAKNVNSVENITSATDILALVQAALQPSAAPQSTTADVVTSSTQPRSFGDAPDPTQLEQFPPTGNNQTSDESGIIAKMSPNPDFGVNQNTQNEPRHVPVWEPRQVSDNYNRGPVDTQGHDSMHVGSRGSQDNQGLRGPQENYNQRLQDNNFNQGSQGYKNDHNQRPQDPENYSQGMRDSQDNYNQRQQGPQSNYNQGQQGPNNNYNQGQQDNQGNYIHGQQGSHGNHNQRQQGSQDNYNQDFRGSQDDYNQNSCGPQDNYNQNSRGPQDNYNQASHSFQDNFNLGSQGNQGIHGSQDNYNNSQRGPQGNFNQGQSSFNQNPGQQQQNSIKQGLNAPLNNFNQGPRGPQNNFNHGGSQGNFNQNPRPFLDNYNQGQRGQDQSYNASRGSTENFNNQGPRGNFMGNRNQDRTGNTNQQQFGNQQKNFRGRGGRGGARGRGRGYF